MDLPFQQFKLGIFEYHQKDTHANFDKTTVF
jgi:hypothetical protein